MALLLEHRDGLVGGAIPFRYLEKYGEELKLPGLSKKPKLKKFLAKVDG